MEKAILPDQSPGSRESPKPSTSSSQEPRATERASSVAQASRSVSPRSASSSTRPPTKRPPGLPPLREAPIGPAILPVIRPKEFVIVEPEASPVVPVPVQILTPMENVKTEESIIGEAEDSDVDNPEPGKVPLVPEKWKEWISFKLEHFFAAVRLKADSDYERECPVPIDSGFKRYYCTEGSTSVRSIRELLEKKFCKEKKYVVHLLHPRFMQELDENITLDILAHETNWKRKRPLRILFTLIPPKEPPPSLEKEPMPVLPGSVEGQAVPMVVEEDVKQINQMIPTQMRLPNGQNIMITNITSRPHMPPTSVPEGVHPRQIPIPIQPQYAMVNPQMVGRAIPMPRKRENSETASSQQPQPPPQMQRMPGGQIVLPFNPNQFTSQQLQQLTMFHQRQQQVIMPQEVKNRQIAHMAHSLVTNRQPTALYPVQVVPGGQMKAVPVSTSNIPPGQQPPQNNAALLHKLLLQQQAQKHQKEKEAHMRAQQLQQMKAQHVQLQKQAVAVAHRAMAKESGPPPAKKMAVESPHSQRPNSVPMTPPEASSQHSMAQVNPKKAVFQVPSPPSPPKPPVTAATPSPPAISPVPSKLNNNIAKLKPFMAKVSVQPIQNHPQTPSTPTTTKTATSPPPSLSPVIHQDNLDFGSMAKMKNQSLGRTFKETLKKSAPPPLLIDGIRAQVNGEGKVQISASADRLELLPAVPAANRMPSPKSLLLYGSPSPVSAYTCNAKCT